jgi:hypothetical protein
MENTLPKEVQDAKAKYGAILHVPFSDGREIYLKQPDKKVLGLAYAKGAKDPLGVAEVLLANCWIAGNDTVKTDVGCLIAIQELANDIAGKVDYTIENAEGKIAIWFGDGMYCFLRRPTRNETSQALIASRKDPFQMVDVILNSCWEEGDQVIKTEAGYLISLIQAVDDIIGVKTAEVKKI